MKEIFKDIPGYEDHYQISNKGRIKSLYRLSPYKNTLRPIKEKILVNTISKQGYYTVKLSKLGLVEYFKIHQLVALVFLNHSNRDKMDIDHIDNNQLNNDVSNLQIITHRENSSKDKISTSGLLGAHWVKRSKRWQSSIYKDGKNIYLGTFNTAQEAHEMYLSKL